MHRCTEYLVCLRHERKLNPERDPQPTLKALAWQVLFGGLNAAMLLLLLSEHKPVSFTDDELALFELHFQA